MPEVKFDQDAIFRANMSYLIPSGYKASYGTSGFRDKGEKLQPILLRCGMLIAIRSQNLGKVTGLMVTASHNPAEDNGVKLIEPSGHMLSQTWEPHAERLANAESIMELCQGVRDLMFLHSPVEGEALDFGAGESGVFIGHDSRDTSVSLASCARKGVECVGGSVNMRGLLTTPQLHWMVREHNLGRPDSEEDYYRTLAKAHQSLIDQPGSIPQEWAVDCANGVGASKLELLKPHLTALHLQLENTGAGVLNENCGADYVQKGTTGQPTAPLGLAQSSASTRCASFDGDADRIVFFQNKDLGLELFDGDRIAVLFATLIQKLIAELPDAKRPTVGVVQTAYANGMSTNFMQEKLGMKALLAKTGVKHLHGLAETFDIGIYFEANGHGTILFKDTFIDALEQSSEGSTDAGKKLRAVHLLSNQATGDAISNLLLVDVALRLLGWSMSEWAALYQDLPSSMLKVKVPDRTKFTTSHAETRTVTPANVQPRLDSLVAKFPSGRCFVRPSGTEDVVRVYAEASTRQGAMELANLAAEIVKDEAAS